MSNRKALVVGINNYPNPVNNLPSCVADARAIINLLRWYAFNEHDIHALYDEQATLDRIKNELEWLLSDPKPDDRLFLYYSGHGYRTQKEEGGILKECLVLYDGLFFDDELSPLTQNLPPGILSVVLDSCFSGGMEKSFFVVKPGQERIRVKTWVPDTQKLFFDSIEAEKNNQIDYQPFGGPVIPQISHFEQKTGSELLKSLSASSESKQLNGLLMSACRADETATASTLHTQGLSVFTFCLTDSIRRYGKDISNQDLLMAIQQKVKFLGMRQTPLLISPPKPQGLALRSFVTFLEGTGKVTRLPDSEDDSFRSPVIDVPAKNIDQEKGFSQMSEMPPPYNQEQWTQFFDSMPPHQQAPQPRYPNMPQPGYPNMPQPGYPNMPQPGYPNMPLVYDEKSLAMIGPIISNLLPTLLPAVLQAISGGSKGYSLGTQPGYGGIPPAYDEKSLAMIGPIISNLLPTLLPAILQAISGGSKGYSPGYLDTPQADEKFLPFLGPILQTLVPTILQAVTGGTKEFSPGTKPECQCTPTAQPVCQPMPMPVYQPMPMPAYPPMTMPPYQPMPGAMCPPAPWQMYCR